MKTTLAIASVMAVCLVAHAQKRPESSGPNVSPASLATLVRGMAQGQVEEHLSTRGHHQFTAALSNATVRCVSYYRNDVYGQYYLVFINDHLATVCAPPPFEMRKEPYMDSWANYRVLGNPEDRVKAVLQAEDMLGPRLTEALTPRPPAKQSVDPGLTAAYLQSQATANKKRQEQRASEFADLRVQFDPYGVDIGSTVPFAEKRVGEAKIIEMLGPGREIRYYGSPEYGRTGSRELMWLSVVYEEGKAVRVFSHDFVDHDKIRPLEEKRSAPKK